MRSRSGIVFAVCAVAAYAAMTTLALSRDPAGWCSFLIGCITIFVFVPVVMAAALTLVSACLAVVLLALAVVFGRGQPTGVGEVIAELMAISSPIVPTYYRMLARVRSPVVWGVAAGLVGTTVRLVAHGVGTAS